MTGQCWAASETDTVGQWLEETRNWLHHVAAESSSKCDAVASWNWTYKHWI